MNQKRAPESLEVVVVDDDPDIRRLIALALERDGFEVTVFEDGLSALRGACRRPRLILLDYMMPTMNAAGFLQAREGHPWLGRVPVVVISAYPELADNVAAETVGVLHKPIDLDILLECVRYHCQRSAPPT